LPLKDTSAANNDDTSNHSQIDVNQMTGTQLISAGDAHAMHLFLFISLVNESFFSVSTCPIVAPLPACQFRDEVLAAYNTTAADTTRHQEKLRAQPADPQGPLAPTSGSIPILSHPFSLLPRSDWWFWFLRATRFWWFCCFKVIKMTCPFF